MEITQSNDRRHDALGDLRMFPDELFCALLEYVTPRDVARLSCVSSVMYILCNEEPLWMHLCLNNSRGLLEYKGSWKGTTLHHLNVSDEFAKSPTKPLHFDGFNSLFLYRRWYRCFTTLDSFFIDKGVLERKKDLSLEEFRREYDVRKPVLLTDLAETWPARSTWTTDQLLQNYGDTAFKISQRSSKKITMRFTDYVAYMKLQHDEDPLYIFDDKFGEAAPGLLKDYSVPHLFREDFFDVLERDQRPAFRWLIIGPERSGASWHVDPALTSAWNTLLSGRKRWALYPPGRVPLGVTVHVNEEDGDVNVEAPSSLQWWLDIYPLLADEDKPIECTQLPGETIYVPSGWWHCVLNLETTIAVTQNFVNTSNFEFVCLDMAPGYHHKGVCRAGLLAVDENYSVNVEKDLSCDTDQFNFPDMTRREKRRRFSKPRKEPCVDNGDGNATNGVNQEFSYHINFLSRFLEEDRDHYNSIWSESNCIGQREMRQWLHKLWVVKPGIRELIWKGACLALNASNWSARMAEICASHDLPSPLDDERLPVGTGSNPVYLTGDKVIKIYVEGGLESSIHSLGTELEFYSLLDKVKSPLREHIPDVLASGILFHESGSHRIVPWDGKGVPDVIAKCDLVRGNCTTDGFHFGVWSKKQLEARKDGSLLPIATAAAQPRIWPYIITKRCKGNIFANLRDELPWDDVLNLASFLGDQLHNLHILPLPSLHDLMYSEVKYEMISTRTIHNDSEKDSNRPSGNASTEAICENFSIPAEWDLFIKILTKRRKSVSNHLAKWGSPIPSSLIEKIDEYIPHNVAVLLDTFKDKDGLYKVSKSPTWIHSDIMDDNVHMEPSVPTHCLDENGLDATLTTNNTVNGCNGDEKQRKWNPSHILDFSDLSIVSELCRSDSGMHPKMMFILELMHRGLKLLHFFLMNSGKLAIHPLHVHFHFETPPLTRDPIFDLIPIHLDIFRGDSQLLKKFLESYRLPLAGRPSEDDMLLDGKVESKFRRLSYRAMCYCILHVDNVLGAVFSLQKELKSAKSWEEVEETVWGELNKYQVFC